MTTMRSDRRAGCCANNARSQPCHARPYKPRRVLPGAELPTGNCDVQSEAACSETSDIGPEAVSVVFNVNESIDERTSTEVSHGTGKVLNLHSLLIMLK